MGLTILTKIFFAKICDSIKAMAEVQYLVHKTEFCSSSGPEICREKTFRARHHHGILPADHSHQSTEGFSGPL